jgi:MFS transporter, DHA1 family, inner membrane transport protein
MLKQVGTATACRILINTARRFVYPFAPVISRGLGVSLTATTTLIAINQATGVLGVFFGPLADRLGYRLMMLTGLAMVVVGMFAGGIFPFYAMVMAALFLAGLGKNVFDPALQAYVGQRVPFQRRGLVIGMLEFSWAGSTLIGIPLIGLLIAHFGWRAPFFVIGGLGLVGAALLWRIFPADPSPSSRRHKARAGMLQSWKGLIGQRQALGAFGFAFFVSAANDNLFVVYGAWLEGAFGLGVVALGASTTIIGVAEFIGEAMTAALADRLGLKRAVLMGLVGCMASYFLLPFLGLTLPAALGGLFLIFISFEFTIVSALTLCTELVPESRATMMSGFLAMAGVGRFFGALLGGPLYGALGISAVGISSGLMIALALASILWGLHGWTRKARP